MIKTDFTGRWLRRCGWLCLVYLTLELPVFADLLDETETSTATGVDSGDSGSATSVPPSPLTGPGTKGKPPATSGKGQPAGGAGRPDAGLVKPAPPKGGVPDGSQQTVLAPKNPGKPKPEGRGRQPVQFESKGMKGLRQKGWVELESEVVINQGNLKMEADKAEIHFDEAENDVRKVQATGRVKISNIDENTGEKLQAFGDQVTFDNKARTVTLEGNARLWRGEDSVIRGKRIIYELDTGWIRADRVAGELSPQGPGK